MSAPHLLLVSSPLIGDGRFMIPLADALGRAGSSVSQCGVDGGSNASIAAGLAKVIGRRSREQFVVVVPYSGAGPLVPAAIAGATNKPAAVIFMDATLPHPGRARIDELRETLPPAAFQQFDQHIRSGGCWPNWTDRALAPLIPDDDARARLLSLVTPQPAPFFDEPLPPDDLPPDLPCAYLRLSPAYDAALATAQAKGWPTGFLQLTHFAPFTHPAEVAGELVQLIDTVLPMTTKDDQRLRDQALRTED